LSASSALLWVAQVGQEKTPRRAFENQANVNTVDQGFRTPLMFAAAYDNFSLVQLLVDHPDININVEDDDGWTALTCAAQLGHGRVVNLLLQCPDIFTDAESVDWDDFVADDGLFWAVYGGHTTTADKLLSLFGHTIAMETVETLLNIALGKGLIRIAQLVVRWL
jgi:serine/threonine-protein phosphatase 6 regulatory ankyrin repeat subunit B